MRHCHSLSLLMLIFTAVSCGTNSAPQSVPVADSQPASSEPPAVASRPAVPITVSVQSIAQLEERIASHQGKVVVVDLWALW